MATEGHQRRHLPALQLASASLSSLAASSRAGFAAAAMQTNPLEAASGALRQPAVCSSGSGSGRAGSSGGSSRRSSARRGSSSSTGGGSGGSARFNFFSKAIRLGAGGGAGAAAFVSRAGTLCLARELQALHGCVRAASCRFCLRMLSGCCHARPSDPVPQFGGGSLAHAAPLWPLRPAASAPKRRQDDGKTRVLILMSDTGGGHRASAEALKAGTPPPALQGCLCLVLGGMPRPRAGSRSEACAWQHCSCLPARLLCLS